MVYERGTSTIYSLIAVVCEGPALVYAYFETLVSWVNVVDFIVKKARKLAA